MIDTPRLSLLFLSIVLTCNQASSQSAVDTLFDNTGKVVAFGEMRNDKRSGVWYFQIRNGKSYETINYLEDGKAIVKYFADGNLILGVEQDAMKLFPVDTLLNNKFYLYKYYNATYDTSNYDFVFNGLAQFYYPTSGTIMIGQFANGEMTGEWIHRYPSGYIMNRKNFVDGILEGEWVTYYNDASTQIWIQGSYHKNAKYGIWKEYYPTGQLKMEGAFNDEIDAIEVTDANIDSLKSIYGSDSLEYYQMAGFPYNFKSGCWKSYSEDGKLDTTVCYELGRAPSRRSCVSVRP